MNGGMSAVGRLRRWQQREEIVFVPDGGLKRSLGRVMQSLDHVSRMTAAARLR